LLESLLQEISMGSTSQGGSSLDDLMLAYTDLSAPAAKGPGGHGFKGPPVKDIRREAPSKVFQHSTKARDWRTLDQSLESVFSAGPALNTSAPAPIIPFTAQPQLLGSVGPGQPPAQLKNASNDIDEWGEFQDFSAAPSNQTPKTMINNSHPHPPAPGPPTHTSQAVGCRLASFQDESPVHRFKNQNIMPAPVPTPHNIPVKIPNFSAPPISLLQPKSQPSSIIDLDDEFGDFAIPTTRSFTSLTSSNIPLSSTKSFSATFPIDKPIQPMQKQQDTFPIDLPISISNTFPIDKPVSVEKTFGIEQPVPLVLPSNPAVFPTITPMPVSVSPLAPMTANSSSADKYSALRMFLDQPEEPIDPLANAPLETNEVIANASVYSRPEVSNDTDFGDFVEVSSISSLPNAKTSLPSNELSDIFSQPNGSLDSNIPNFLNSSQASIDIFPIQPPSASSGPNKLPPAVPIQFTSPQPRNLPTLLPSPTTQNEELNIDEWSLPATSEVESDNARSSINLHKPPPKLTSIPYLCSSPPPDPAGSSILSSSPPLMSSPGSQLNVEEFSLPSEQFGFSDQEIFGIKSTKNKKEASQPQSLQDILSLSKKSNKHASDFLKPAVEENSDEVKAVDPQPISLDNSRHGSPSSLRVSSKSPESQSVASLEFESHNDSTRQFSDRRSDMDSLDNKGITSSPPLSKYNGFVTEEIQPTSSPSKEWCLLLTEVLTLIESTRDTFDNIISEDLKEEVITSEQGKNFLLNLFEVHKVYNRVASSYKKRLQMEVEEEKVGLEQVGQFCDEIDRDWKRLKEHCDSYRALEKPDDSADDGDGVCGICLGVGGSLVYGGGVYHPGCANYWVNCVRDGLPRLVEPN